MADERVPVRVVGFVEAEVDGERVLLSPKDFTYFGVEGSGAAVWDLIDGTRTLEEVVEELVATFSASEAQIRSETMEFVESLVASGLVAPLAG